MAKKKGKGGGGKGKGKGGGSAFQLADNAVLEFPPRTRDMSLLYRKASFDVLPLSRSESLGQLLRFHQDQTHRAVIPGYAEFLKTRKFWMSGDDVPDGAMPRAPGAPKAGGEKKKKKGKKK